MRLIDADTLNARLSRDATPYFTVCDIENAPTIDPVRAAGGCYCKECRRWKPDGSYGMDLDGVKRPYGACEITHHCHKDNHFCGYGRLREAQDA